MSVCSFNYKYIKEKATPGSWRRGYEASKTGIVTAIEQKLAGVEAKVKGNYKDSYDVSLSFSKSGVKAQCSCPLKEEWCKHSIAVGLKVIEEGIYDNYLLKTHGIEPDMSDVDTDLKEEPDGDYIFHFNPKRRQNFFSLLVMDRNTGKVIRDLEAVLRKIIAEQKEHPEIQLNNSQKIEIAILGVQMGENGYQKLDIDTLQEE